MRTPLILVLIAGFFLQFGLDLSGNAPKIGVRPTVWQNPTRGDVTVGAARSFTCHEATGRRGDQAQCGTGGKFAL